MRAFAVLFVSPVYAELYRWVDDNGNVHYSDKKNSDNASQPKHSFNAHSLAIQFTDQTGNAREILTWYKVNKIKFHFDVTQNIFVAG